MLGILYRDTLAYHKAEVKSDCVSLNELSMSPAEAPALSALVTLEKEESRKKERNRGRLLSSCHQICSNCTSECKRGREGAGVRGRGSLAQWQGAQWWHSSLSVGTHTHTDRQHTHTSTPGGFPPGVPKWSNTSHHCLITPVPKDRREECTEVFHRRCTVYHWGIVGHYVMLSWCVFTLVCVCVSRQRESRVMRSSLYVMFCSSPRLFDGRFITSLIISLQWNLTAWFTALCKFWRVCGSVSKTQPQVCFLCLAAHFSVFFYAWRVFVCVYSTCFTRPPPMHPYISPQGWSINIIVEQENPVGCVISIICMVTNKYVH